jgi:hypothetical protein
MPSPIQSLLNVKFTQTWKMLYGHVFQVNPHRYVGKDRFRCFDKLQKCRKMMRAEIGKNYLFGLESYNNLLSFV